jgi:bacteriorhodopsin
MAALSAVSAEEKISKFAELRTSVLVILWKKYYTLWVLLEGQK